MGRPKKVTTTLQSIDDCTAAMSELLVAQASVEKLAASQALAVAIAQRRWEDDLNVMRKRASELAANLEAFYYAHLAELEDGDRKSFKLPNGVMGRRFGAGKLAPLNRAWAWRLIEVKVRELWGSRFFRDGAPELNRVALKDELDAEQLARAGLKVKNEENFYAEPDRPATPTEAQ